MTGLNGLDPEWTWVRKMTQKPPTFDVQEEKQLFMKYR